ncbi:hypothetical protein HCN44_003418 [Aphidius gifuensis]|uniref:Uncharacterized protein n=1 Tax=Aphidius gifuensis TaxID=684658 RepID=A0A834XXX8_APHGI|nr:hypothetical protein HCN44_003418 [Aphidius gifuensis]
MFLDLVQNALEENGLEEKMYLEIKKPAITSVEILLPTKRITMNSRKITKKQKDLFIQFFIFSITFRSVFGEGRCIDAEIAACPGVGFLDGPEVTVVV